MPSFSIFPNVEAFDAWMERNCERCSKGYYDKTGHWICKIRAAIIFPGMLDGALLKGAREAIAKRLKWDGETYLTHDCPEFDPL